MCTCNSGRSCNQGPRGLKGEPGIQGAKGDTGPSGGLFSCDTYTAFAGGGQSSATNLVDNDNLVETVATTGDSVKLLPALQNVFQKVRNYGANTMNVYPQSGDAINALGINVPYALGAGAIVEFVCFADGTYTT